MGSKNKNIELIGSKINNITILNYKTIKGESGATRSFFDCECFCGNKFTSRTDAIKTNTTQSCGCISFDLISQKLRKPNDIAIINLVYKNYIAGAIKRNLTFDLSLDQVKQFLSQNCFYCGQAPELSTFAGYKNRRTRVLFYNGIDRKGNNLGYSMDNCVSCCTLCNRAKLDLSYNAFNEWINRMINYRASISNEK